MATGAISFNPFERSCSVAFEPTWGVFSFRAMTIIRRAAEPFGYTRSLFAAGYEDYQYASQMLSHNGGRGHSSTVVWPREL